MTPRSDEAEALLARLHNNHVHKFVARSDEELHAHIAAAEQNRSKLSIRPVLGKARGGARLAIA
jgi:hypothetical protein